MLPFYIIQFVLYKRMSGFFTKWFCIIKSLLLITLDIFPQSLVSSNTWVLKMYSSAHKIYIIVTPKQPTNQPANQTYRLQPGTLKYQCYINLPHGNRKQVTFLKECNWKLLIQDTNKCQWICMYIILLWCGNLNIVIRNTNLIFLSCLI